ncbi:hypothetical protein HNQ88_001612 [Aureibacter tunicatorum]|uniref:Uncharacterized protein n=1 Tax=Aureibacter tunicatorum TaxID=866807 RepID=A0AAE3XMC8_9BACT|nr:hypothetical protein [Aureibacter tunicatorum]BDD05494.1 hypothetical protein AUTU_29770 [Aureibacter tunicatorum]
MEKQEKLIKEWLYLPAFPAGSLSPMVAEVAFQFKT